uniref:NADH dehydrogenase subunit 2 n=1 Tax=Sphyranura euryceae TaxID=2996394 RepID=A0AA51UAI6_9PLAT|nr:NADH dehydrogenase subunit 2 [Sphyranura euryceae]WMV02086.1 NADH dehydrogenase subunit 2 [Sphyranura euryceae]
MYYIFMILLSFGFGLIGLFNSSLVFLTILLEIMSLVFIISFFFNSGPASYNVPFKAAVLFFVVTSFSGLLLLSGWVINNITLLALGIIFKLGIFPFSGWMISLYSISGWMPIFLLSTFFKLPIIFICSISNFWSSFIVSYELIFFFTFLVSIWVLLNSNNYWSSLIVSTSLSSSINLIIFGSSGNFLYFLVYFILGCFYIFILLYLFLRNSEIILFYNVPVMFLFLLFPFPWSFIILYKILGAFMYSCLSLYFFTFIFWLSYSIVEQVFYYWFFISESTNILGFSSETR